MIDLPAIRARHALAQERLDANDTGWPLTLTLAAAHADRAALLAELADNERVLFEAGVRLGRCARERDDARAARDRLVEALCALTDAVTDWLDRPGAGFTGYTPTLREERLAAAVRTARAALGAEPPR